MRMIDGIPVFGTTVDEGAMSQIRTCARTADHVALMGDHHKGYAVPIGGVVAYTDSISPSGVGFDIACGNKAVLTDASAAEVKANIGKIMDDTKQVRNPELERPFAADILFSGKKCEDIK